MPLFLFIDCCLHFHEKVAGSCNHQNSQGRIKQACPFSSYIIDYELGVLCSKEPIPIENRCKDGQTSDDDKNALYDICLVIVGMFMRGFPYERNGFRLPLLQ